MATSPIGIIIYKASGQCIAANPAAGKILGATPDQLMQQNYQDLKAWKEYGIYTMAMNAIEKKEPVSLEMFYVSTFGKEIWMDIICAPFTSGGELNLLFMFEDFSIRKQAEINLQNATEKMEEWVMQLERRNQAATHLREMGEMLQVCNKTSEAYTILRRFGTLLFPASSGGVFLTGASQQIVETPSFWGGIFLQRNGLSNR